MIPRRRFLLGLLAAAAVAALAQGATGMTDLALYAAPLLIVVGLLLGGRFVAEERIVAHWCASSRPRRARVANRWAHVRDAALTSLLERGPRRLRGPPVARAAA